MAIDTQDYNIYKQHVTTWKYIFDWSVLNSLLNDLIKGTITGYSISDLFSNNSDYFISVMWYPLKVELFIDGTPATTSSITIGKKTNLAYTCCEFGSNGKQKPAYKICTISLTREFNNFLDFAPYTKFKLFIPFFEFFELDGKDLYGHTLDVYMSVDFNSGKGAVNLYIDDTYLYATKSTQLGIEIPIGKSNAEEQKRNLILHGLNLIGDIGGMALSGGNAISGAGLFKGYFKDASGLLASQVDHMTGYKGGGGDINMLTQYKKVILIKEKPNVSYTPVASLEGKKCNKYLSLSSLTGYTEVGEIHFNPSNAKIYNDEITEIVSLLKQGVIL